MAPAGKNLGTASITSPKGGSKDHHHQCLCSPTTHQGSFRCRFHRTNISNSPPAHKTVFREFWKEYALKDDISVPNASHEVMEVKSRVKVKADDQSMERFPARIADAVHFICTSADVNMCRTCGT